MQKTIPIYFIVLVLALMVSACGPMPKDGMQAKSVAEALGPYLEQFEVEASNRNVSVDASNIIMSFSESMPATNIPNGMVVAYCQRTFQGPIVMVKGSEFDKMNLSTREQLIFHELGHCLLGAPHNETLESAFDWHGSGTYYLNMPSSIMNDTLFNSNLYNSNRDLYLNRLFNIKDTTPLYYNRPSQFNANNYL